MGVDTNMTGHFLLAMALGFVASAAGAEASPQHAAENFLQCLGKQAGRAKPGNSAKRLLRAAEPSLRTRERH